MIAWTDHTHGRGPGFRSRAELRRRRQLRAGRSALSGTASERQLLKSMGYARMGVDAPFYVDTVIDSVRVLPPWYVRVWRRILAVLGYGPFGGEQ
jgi:hypothetical protein